MAYIWRKCIATRGKQGNFGGKASSRNKNASPRNLFSIRTFSRAAQIRPRRNNFSFLGVGHVWFKLSCSHPTVTRGNHLRSQASRPENEGWLARSPGPPPPSHPILTFISRANFERHGQVRYEEEGRHRWWQEEGGGGWEGVEDLRCRWCQRRQEEEGAKEGEQANT